MAENFDLNNLYLDDNNNATVPEGDYHFRVDGYDLDYSTSDKMPENTQVIKVHMTVPCNVNGEYVEANVRLNLNVYSKALFAIRQFFECIGLMPEKGRAKMPELDKMIGREGIFKLLVGVSNKGNEYNQVDMCYPPSKAPKVCGNDDVWGKAPAPIQAQDGFRPMDEAEVNPFAI